MIPLTSVPPLLGSIANLLLGLFVISRSPTKLTHRTFLAFSCSVFLWNLSAFVMFLDISEGHALFFARIIEGSVIIVAPCYLHFVYALLEATKRHIKELIIVDLIGACLLFANFFGLIISDVHRLTYSYYGVGGKFFLVVPMYIGAVIGYALFRAIQHLPVLSGHKKSQIQYFTFALFIATIAGLHDFLPIFGFDKYPGTTTAVYPYGSLVIVLYSIIIAYTILKHQFLDIEVIVRRATVFAGLFAFVYAIFTAFTMLGKKFFEANLGWDAWVATIPTIFIITLALRPLENLLVNLTEMYLFQKKYDYRQLLKTFTAEVLTLLDLQKLIAKTVEGLSRIIKLESCSILLQNPSTGIYELKASVGIREANTSFSPDDTLVYYLNASNEPIQRDADIERLGSHRGLRDDFIKLNAELCLPIILHDKLIGFISLGRKKSGEPYNQDDIDVLISLSRTEAIAISNAQLFQELSKTQAEAAQREKMAVIGTLAAGINHEICNPLGIARGQCEMFLLNYQDGLYKDVSEKELVEKCTVIFEKVIKEVDRATGITKRLSSFAKPAKQFMFGEVDISEEVQEILAILGHELRLDNIEVVTNIPKETPKIYADKKQVQEIIFNIVRNAAQAITGKGSIAIAASERGDKVVIEIEDTGCGIPADKLNEIFNPFYTTKAPGKGTGLGLFIVKQIVERNKGTILVQSEVGKGTKFTLAFATARQMAAA